MSTQAISRRTPSKSFNPSSYKAEALDLMKANPSLAAQSMTQLAGSKRAAERELNIATETTQDLAAFAVSSILVGLLGMLDGTIMAKRDAIIEGFETDGLIQPGEEPPSTLWKAEGIKEPGKLWFMPYNLLIPIVLGGVAVGLGAGREEDESPSTAERVFAVSATTTFGLYVASITRAAGYRFQQRRMLNAAAQTAMTGT